MQDLALLLVELQEVLVSPFLQTAKVTLDESMTLWSVISSFQFCVFCRFAVGTLPIVQIINEDVKQDQTRY